MSEQAFPDVEDALIELLTPIATAGTAFDDETFAVPIRVNRVAPGGANRQGWQDTASVRVTCRASTRDESKRINAAVRAALVGLDLVQTTAGLIDSIREDTAPVPDFTDVPDQREVSSTWTVVSRLQQVPAPVDG